MGKSKQVASKPRRTSSERAAKLAASTAPGAAPSVQRQFKKHEFYSWLLLAIRASGSETFEAEGPIFYDSFLRAVSVAKGSETYTVDGLSEMIPDPVFGVVHQANEMLLEAEEDRIISLLNPLLKEARFKISLGQASKELAESGDAKSWFEGLARAFIGAQQVGETVQQGARTETASVTARSSVEHIEDVRNPRQRGSVETQSRT